MEAKTGKRDCLMEASSSSIGQGDRHAAPRPVTSGLSRVVRDGGRIGLGGRIVHTVRGGRSEAIRRTAQQQQQLKTVDGDDGCAAGDGSRPSKLDGDPPQSSVLSFGSEAEVPSSSALPANVVRDMKTLTVVCRELTDAVAESREPEENFAMGNWLAASKTTSPRTGAPPPNLTKVGRLGDVEIDDLDAADESTSGLLVSPCDASHVWLTLPTGLRLDADTAASLKMLMFGDRRKDFPEEWRMQSFSFNAVNPELSYGIVQHKGGPCGVLACVQAHLLKELLFPKGRRTRTKASGGNGFSSAEVGRCLALALAAILWRAGSQKTATVAFPSDRNSSTDDRRLGLCDGFVEKMDLMKFSDLTALQSFLSRHVVWYAAASSRGACIAFLYSAVLSRTLESVKDDMDEAGNCLIGAHSYCSQEVINLLLTGHASSNVFDDAVTLDEGTDSESTLRGVTRRSDFGFLALFEHYGSCQVGVNLKCPRYPIWVVCSESHYSVLFAKQFGAIDAAAAKSSANFEEDAAAAAAAPTKFDIYLYDGLLQQYREIRLTVDVTGETGKPRKHSKDPVPPLELCIRTKWKDAVVAWNGTEPLL